MPGSLEIVITDGGSGFAKMCREARLDTWVRRCVLSVFHRVVRYATLRVRGVPVADD